MAYFSVLSVTPTAEDWIPGYIGPVTALVAKHGGICLARTASHERVEGEGQDAAKAFIDDPEYQPYLKARTAGSISHHFLIEGKDDLA